MMCSSGAPSYGTVILFVLSNLTILLAILTKPGKPQEFVHPLKLGTQDAYSEDVSFLATPLAITNSLLSSRSFLMEHVENQFNGGLAAGGIFTYCVDKAVVDAVVDLFWSCTNAKMKQRMLTLSRRIAAGLKLNSVVLDLIYFLPTYGCWS